MQDITVRLTPQYLIPAAYFLVKYQNFQSNANWWEENVKYAIILTRIEVTQEGVCTITEALLASVLTATNSYYPDNVPDEQTLGYLTGNRQNSGWGIENFEHTTPNDPLTVPLQTLFAAEGYEYVEMRGLTPAVNTQVGLDILFWALAWQKYAAADAPDGEEKVSLDDAGFGSNTSDLHLEMLVINTQIANAGEVALGSWPIRVDPSYDLFYPDGYNIQESSLPLPMVEIDVTGGVESASFRLDYLEDMGGSRLKYKGIRWVDIQNYWELIPGIRENPLGAIEGTSSTLGDMLPVIRILLDVEWDTVGKSFDTRVVLKYPPQPIGEWWGNYLGVEEEPNNLLKVIQEITVTPGKMGKAGVPEYCLGDPKEVYEATYREAHKRYISVVVATKTITIPVGLGFASRYTETYRGQHVEWSVVSSVTNFAEDGITPVSRTHTFWAWAQVEDTSVEVAIPPYVEQEVIIQWQDNDPIEGTGSSITGTGGTGTGVGGTVGGGAGSSDGGSGETDTGFACSVVIKPDGTMFLPEAGVSLGPINYGTADSLIDQYTTTFKDNHYKDAQAEQYEIITPLEEWQEEMTVEFYLSAKVDALWPEGFYYNGVITVEVTRSKDAEFLAYISHNDATETTPASDIHPNYLVDRGWSYFTMYSLKEMTPLATLLLSGFVGEPQTRYMMPRSAAYYYLPSWSRVADWSNAYANYQTPEAEALYHGFIPYDQITLVD